jgi:ABC-type dipeptide/oligopeptide/nickel transport system permease component
MESNASVSSERKILSETPTGISIFGFHIPYWLIILVLILFIVYMWVENKSPGELLSISLGPEPFSVSSLETSPLFRSLSFVPVNK